VQHQHDVLGHDDLVAAMAITLAIEAAMPSMQIVIAASWRFSAL
jgi:hypothetical protein